MEAGANEGILPALDEETLNRARNRGTFLADPLPTDLLSRSSPQFYCMDALFAAVPARAGKMGYSDPKLTTATAMH